MCTHLFLIPRVGSATILHAIDFIPNAHIDVADRAITAVRSVNVDERRDTEYERDGSHALSMRRCMVYVV